MQITRKVRLEFEYLCGQVFDKKCVEYQNELPDWKYAYVSYGVWILAMKSAVICRGNIIWD